MSSRMTRALRFAVNLVPALVAFSLLVSAEHLTTSSVPGAAAQGAPDCGSPADPSVQIQVQTGQQFTIALAANRTTGFSWSLAQPPDASVAQFLMSSYVAPAAVLPGAGGEECWTFSAVGAGETLIDFAYARPFEPNAAPARTAEFDVVVQDAALQPCTRESDPNVTIHANPQDQFSIALRANHTTPFAWKLVTPLDESIVQLVSTTYQEGQPSLPGSGGIECWTFVAVAEGEASIQFGYAPLFPAAAPAVQTESFDLQVP